MRYTCYITCACNTYSHSYVSMVITGGLVPSWHQDGMGQSAYIRNTQRNVNSSPDSKAHGANMGPIWGRQDPGGPHVGPMNFAIWVHSLQDRDNRGTVLKFKYLIAITMYDAELTNIHTVTEKQHWHTILDWTPFHDIDIKLLTTQCGLHHDIWDSLNRATYQKDTYFTWYIYAIKPAWISHHNIYKMWDKITYPFLNFDGATIEVWEWISNSIPPLTGHVISDPC